MNALRWFAAGAAVFLVGAVAAAVAAGHLMGQLDEPEYWGDL